MKTLRQTKQPLTSALLGLEFGKSKVFDLERYDSLNATRQRLRRKKKGDWTLAQDGETVIVTRVA